MILVGDEGGERTRSKKVSTNPQRGNVVETYPWLEPRLRRIWRDVVHQLINGGDRWRVFIRSRSPGRNAFIRTMKTQAGLGWAVPRLLEHRVRPKIRGRAPRERMVHLGFRGDNWRVVVSLPTLGKVLWRTHRSAFRLRWKSWRIELHSKCSRTVPKSQFLDT